MTAFDLVDTYISFFEKRGHKRILNSPLVPQDDPTTLFTSSGMQPLVPYLLGEIHPQGKRLVNVQNCFRAQDIDEIGDNRHTTFFRMLGNWSLGDYFKKEQLPWFFEFLVSELGLDPKRLYVTIFNGYKTIPRDNEAAEIWKELFSKAGIDPKDRIYYYGAEENWWSRAGEPEHMPPREPGGPDSEVFFDFYPQDPFSDTLKKYSHNGRLLEIGNSVFMQYQKQQDGSFTELPRRNVDFGGGLERLLAATQNQQDLFQTILFKPIINSIEKNSGKSYNQYQRQMRILADHLIAACFMAASDIFPSNKQQGYIMRRLIRRGLDNLYALKKQVLTPILEIIVEQYKATDPHLVEKFEHIKGVLLEEEQKYNHATGEAKKFIQKKYRLGDELKGTAEITSDDAFVLYTTHGLSPTQIKSLGYVFNEQDFAEKMKTHQTISRKGAQEKFRGGLADTQEKTIMGHTATHLLHQALRDILGKTVHQTGSNITVDRLRFDFNYNKKLTDEMVQKVEAIVNQKIQDNLSVYYEFLTQEEADKLGAIGLFKNTYGEKVKIYLIADSRLSRKDAYSIEYCGGPHVDFTGELKRFKIIKQENIGHGQKRIYAVVGE